MTVRDLTILVPAYNEVDRIEPTLNELLSFAAPRFDTFEILVVDDGSSDGTLDLVRERFAGRVSVVQRLRRGGKGAAVRSGVFAARGQWILFTDADLSIPIYELEKLLPSTDQCPIVIGSKRAPGSELDYPAARRALGGFGQLLIAWFVVSGFHDTQCGFKLLRADVARELFGLQKIDGFGFDFEILFLARRLGYAVSEVPVRCEHHGGGTVRLKSYFSVLLEIGKVNLNRWLGRYPRR